MFWRAHCTGFVASANLQAELRAQRVRRRQRKAHPLASAALPSSWPFVFWLPARSSLFAAAWPRAKRRALCSIHHHLFILGSAPEARWQWPGRREKGKAFKKVTQQQFNLANECEIIFAPLANNLLRQRSRTKERGEQPLDHRHRLSGANATCKAVGGAHQLIMALSAARSQPEIWPSGRPMSRQRLLFATPSARRSAQSDN